MQLPRAVFGLLLPFLLLDLFLLLSIPGELFHHVCLHLIDDYLVLLRVVLSDHELLERDEQIDDLDEVLNLQVIFYCWNVIHLQLLSQNLMLILPQQLDIQLVLAQRLPLRQLEADVLLYANPAIVSIEEHLEA